MIEQVALSPLDALRAAGSNIKLQGRFPKTLRVEHPVSITGATLVGFVSLGSYTYIGNTSEVRDTTFGRFCSVARRVTIGLSEHPSEFLTSHPIAFGGGEAFRNDPYFTEMQQRHQVSARGRTDIGHDVWIGDGAYIRRGVSIGHGAIIAARAVVTKDVRPYAIVGGTPGREIKRRFDDETIMRLIASEWWKYDLRGVDIRFSDVKEALEIIEDRKHSLPLLPSVMHEVVTLDGQPVLREFPPAFPA